MDLVFFDSAANFRHWLEDHHTEAGELVLGFHKKATGRGGIAYPEAVDEALCFGWIDGIRRRVDDASYSVRFTPRRKRSVWSEVNIRRVGELKAEGRMRPAGLAAFETLEDGDGRRYSYEAHHSVALDPAYEAGFQADGPAWEFFLAQAPSYRQAATFWVMDAKREETRRRRLATLMDDSAHRRRLRQLSRP